MGALHGLSLSPVSSAVLQILGAIAAGAVGLIAGTEREPPNPITLRQTLPRFTAVIFAVLVGYWAGWGGTKFYLVKTFELSTTLANLSSEQKVDAYRLIAIGRSLGVPKIASEARISQLVSNQGLHSIRQLSPREEARAIALLAQEAANCKPYASDLYANALTEISRLGEDAQELDSRFPENKWVTQYLDLRMNALLIPLPEDAPQFELLMAAASCKHGQEAARQFAALDRKLRRGPITIEDEIARIRANSPGISTENLLRDPGVENEAFR